MRAICGDIIWVMASNVDFKIMIDWSSFSFWSGNFFCRSEERAVPSDGMGWLRRLLVQFWDVRWTGRFAVLGVLFLGDGYWSVSRGMISWGFVDFIF